MDIIELHGIEITVGMCIIILLSIVIRTVAYVIIYREVVEVNIKFIIAFNILRGLLATIGVFIICWIGDSRDIGIIIFIAAIIALFIGLNTIETKVFNKITEHEVKIINFVRIIAVILAIVIGYIIIAETSIYDTIIDTLPHYEIYRENWWHGHTADDVNVGVEGW